MERFLAVYEFHHLDDVTQANKLTTKITCMIQICSKLFLVNAKCEPQTDRTSHHGPNNQREADFLRLTLILP